MQLDDVVWVGRSHAVCFNRLVVAVDMYAVDVDSAVVECDSCRRDVPGSVVDAEGGWVDVDVGGKAIAVVALEECRQVDATRKVAFSVVLPIDVGVESVVGAGAVEHEQNVAVFVVELAYGIDAHHIVVAVEVNR